jgi:FkbM family methyltransferase
MSAHVIYDFGMNNGDDVEYYLLKAERVVGVEANPALCELVRERFPSEIARGRLTVLNVALAERESAEPLTFYVHKHNHVLSQLPRPPRDLMDEFMPIEVPCRTPASIVAEHGEPLYVKVDVEHYDYQVLQNLFAHGIVPPEISAESHSIRVFAALVVNGYKAFTLVEGSTVPQDYGDAAIAIAGRQVPFRFKPHSAGPFGEDIRSRWEDADSFFHTLAIAGLGWKDIHASRVMDPSPASSNKDIVKRQAAALLRKIGRAAALRTIGRMRR